MVVRVPHPFSRILRKGWGITIDWEGHDFSRAARTETTEGAPSLPGAPSFFAYFAKRVGNYD